MLVQAALAAALDEVARHKLPAGALPDTGRDAVAASEAAPAASYGRSASARASDLSPPPAEVAAAASFGRRSGNVHAPNQAPPRHQAPVPGGGGAEAATAGPAVDVSRSTTEGSSEATTEGSSSVVSAPGASTQPDQARARGRGAGSAAAPDQALARALAPAPAQSRAEAPVRGPLARVSSSTTGSSEATADDEPLNPKAYPTGMLQAGAALASEQAVLPGRGASGAPAHSQAPALAAEAVAGSGSRRSGTSSGSYETDGDG